MKTKPRAMPKLALCTCGHTGNNGSSQSQHGPRFAEGHGACKVPGCTCKQFTWAKYVK